MLLSMSSSDLPALHSIFSADPYLVSDTHFFHDKVFSQFEPIRQTYAPTRAAFDDRMTTTLRDHAPFVHLGDVCINTKDPDEFAKRIRSVSARLQGVAKVLIPGNHDKRGEDLYAEFGWIVVRGGIDLTTPEPTLYPDAPPFIVIREEGRRLFLSHEPALLHRPATPHDREITRTLATWFTQLGAQINVHGHVHSHSLDHPTFRNVSIEALMFTPIRLSQVVLARQGKAEPDVDFAR